MAPIVYIYRFLQTRLFVRYEWKPYQMYYYALSIPALLIYCPLLESSIEFILILRHFPSGPISSEGQQ